MRKALIGMIMAATAITPVAAEAQGRRGGGDRGHRSEQSSGEDRVERIQQRNERREARQVQEAPEAQPQSQPAPQPQIAQRQWRGGDDGNRGGRGDRGNDGNRGGRGDDGNRGDRGNDGNRGGRGGDGDRGDRGGDRRGQTSIYPQAWQGDPNSPMLRHYQQLERRNQAEGRRDRRGDRDWRDDRGDRGDRGDRSERRRDWRNDWNRGWRSDRRYDWNNWRFRNRSIFRLSPYYSPYRGYSYRRFSIGFLLQPLFYSQRYWIGDPWQYRLPQAPYGTQWVRYYDDVLLVDVYTGEVVDVIYNFFW